MVRSSNETRTEGDVRRRQALADAAAGVGPGEADVPERSARTRRFRCVVYLCGAPRTDLAAPRKECVEYAEAFGWEIVEVVEDRAGLLPPSGRGGLARALARVADRDAGAVLTAWRSMVSPVVQEYDEVAREVEKAGGFLHVMDAARDGRRAAR
ncbi:recombinase family protein [Streptomyces longispororuber]|uniref:recombinase family protein n=1 Tax=Streptomyces longispororuber TaxID=68230 RepID=UPI003701BE8E